MDETIAATTLASVSCNSAIRQWKFELISHVDQDWTVDLQDTGIDSTAKEKFYLSENTYWGTDMWDSSQEFYYDPNSTIIASATRWGGVHDGSLSYQGIKSKALHARMAAFSPRAHSETEMPVAEQFESYAASVAHETVRQLFENAFAADFTAGFPWTGLVKWGQRLSPQQVLAAVTLVTSALIARGYALTFQTTTNADGSKTTTIRFGPHQLPGAPGAVPAKIQADWNASVAAAKQYNPQSLGVSANTAKSSKGDDVSDSGDASNVNDVNSEATSAAVQVA